MVMKYYSGIILVCVLFWSCGKLQKEKFTKLSASKTGIDFLNELIENDTLNYTIFPYMYMGGGVSVGDINNDGLDDIFFTGNLVPNRLYLNKGDMRFEDISQKAGITGSGQWFTGSTMADVNNDGWLDIYVCVSAKYPPADNLLFINNKDNTFTESAKSYGINDTSSSVQATFFDYNNDGLQDLFVANYPIVLVSMGADFYREKMNQNRYEESGHLYKNNGNGTFTDVTDEAGVRNFGMSIGVVAMDFNNDGWKDLYISNDFNPPDYFYLNNGDGTFSERVKDATMQTSIFGMGFDAADVNNDGLIDLYQIDMTPPDHPRRVLNVMPMRQETFDRSVDMGMHHQYMHNSLQINNGIFDSIPVFSNITLYANTAYTDWSWGGLFMDMDNDGLKDLFVSTGVLKDINNQDVLAAPRGNVYFGTKQKEYRPELFPSTPVRNFVYHNNGDYSFTNKAEEWGFTDLNLTNGVSYGDFDNDGDLDLVVHNVNEVSSVYENKTVSKDHHFLKINLKGPGNNLFGLGSIVTIKTGETMQKQELTLTRGYQSSVPPYFHFGLGNNAVIDELTITWPDGKAQTLTNVSAGQTLVLNYENGVTTPHKNVNVSAFCDMANASGIQYQHKENKYNDFEHEILLPYRYSNIGPGLAVGDINGDGLDDFYIGNAEGNPGALYIQQKDGGFEEQKGPWIADSTFEDTGALIFDADNDNLNDLLVVSGGNNKLKSGLFTHRLYLNNGKGFTKAQALPSDLNQSGKCIKTADFDNDGDMDIFIGGRIVPGQYPVAANSYILRNNGKKGSELRFENITSETAPVLLNSGLVTDALWEDFDADGDVDFIFTGEWMNLRFLENNAGSFIEVTDKLGLSNTCGWWYSLFATDVDGDGDRDIIAGNLGLNHRYHVKNNERFEIYYNDFDVDGKSDIVLSYTEKGIQYPAVSYTATTRQIPIIIQRYQTVESFAKASLEEIYGVKMLESSLHYSINTFTSVWLENLGNGKYKTHPLPAMAQFSSINAIEEIEYQQQPSLVIAGNLMQFEVETPNNDASVGLIMQYGAGKLTPVFPAESRLCIRGDVKDLKKIKLANGKIALLVARNNNTLQLLQVGQCD